MVLQDQFIPHPVCHSGMKLLTIVQNHGSRHTSAAQINKSISVMWTLLTVRCILFLSLIYHRILGRLRSLRDGPSRWSANLLTGSSVVRTRPLPLDPPLSRLGQPGSIPALMQPSGGITVRHRKDATVERFFVVNIPSNGTLLGIKTLKDNNPTHTALFAGEHLDVPTRTTLNGLYLQTQSYLLFVNVLHEGCLIFQQVRVTFRTLFSVQHRSDVTSLRCLTVMPPEGSTRAGILPSCPILDRDGSRGRGRVRTTDLPVSKFAL
ncbi:hypothetical protein CSKR_102777 [Clonorchis sinensis]|uniref:Uncharacterized protein n=1 Tax=Clonorchis sinensis TaxID=79923 RepID=A0A419Q5F8_CLOSI|nr:hypothetical protein CSKR_102777 [Clonorchis sinensis]